MYTTHDSFHIVFTNLTISTASFFMRHHRSVEFTTLSTYRRQLSASRAHMCLWYSHTYTRATVSLVAGPYRLIDGDSRVGNPIHRAEDKFHVPQCVSKWEPRRVAVLVRLRLHRETMAPADLCVRAYMCARGGAPTLPLPPPPPSLLLLLRPSSRTVYIGMAGCRKFLATRIV